MTVEIYVWRGLFAVVQPSLVGSQLVPEACSVSMENDCSQASVLQATTATADVSMTTGSVCLFVCLICKLLFNIFFPDSC